MVRTPCPKAGVLTTARRRIARNDPTLANARFITHLDVGTRTPRCRPRLPKVRRPYPGKCFPRKGKFPPAGVSCQAFSRGCYREVTRWSPAFRRLFTHLATAAFIVAFRSAKVVSPLPLEEGL